MKKSFLNFLCLGAIALVSSVGFSACSENDLNEPSTNPTGEVANSDVKVNFVMNVEYGQSATTRMSANTVQWPSSTGNTFRGIDNAILLPYISSGATFLTEEYAATGDDNTRIKAARKFDLAKLYTTEADNTQNGETNANQTTSSRRIIELPMPLQSNLMLIYGKAIKGESTTLDMDAIEGKIDMNISDDAKDTKIKLVSRLDNSEVPLYQKAERLTAFILNRIMHARVSERTTQTSYEFKENHQLSGFRRAGDYTWTYTDDGHPNAVSWAGLGALYSAYVDEGAHGASGMTALEESLGKAYYTITKVGHARVDQNDPTKIIPGEYRAGSAEAVARMLHDLYALCEKTYGATPTSNKEADAMRLAARIGHQINGFYEIGSQGIALKDFGSASEPSTIRGFIESQKTISIDNADPLDDTIVKDDDFESGKFSGLTRDIMRSFPTCFGIPTGAAQLSYETPSPSTLPDNDASEIIKEGDNAVDQFVYHYTNQPFVTDMATTTPSFNPQKYMYPAELAYFVNSPLRVSDIGLDSSDVNTLFPNGTNNWDTDEWAGWTTGAVKSTTKSIAVQKNINYGVAMLKTTVSTVDNRTSLDDNRNNFNPGDGDASVLVSGLRMTGILIGGQDNTVDWQYLPVDPDNATYVIYDNAVGSYNSNDKRYDGIALDGSTPNYTIVFDNYTPGGTQKSVRFALEFRNGSEDFWGKDNLIRQDGTFYLLGELSLNSAEGGPSWDKYYQVPPLWQTDNDPGIPNDKHAGDSTEKTRVFIQDHVTVANVKLGENALKQAVVSVPDLRTSSMSLGLSVDLSWTQGLTFNPVIGGN